MFHLFIQLEEAAKTLGVVASKSNRATRARVNVLRTREKVFIEPPSFLYHLAGNMYQKTRERLIYGETV